MVIVDEEKKWDVPLIPEVLFLVAPLGPEDQAYLCYPEEHIHATLEQTILS